MELIYLLIAYVLFTTVPFVINESKNISIYSLGNWFYFKAFFMPVVFVGLLINDPRQEISRKHLYALEAYVSEAAILTFFGLTLFNIGYFILGAQRLRVNFILSKFCISLGKKLTGNFSISLIFLFVLTGVIIAFQMGVSLGRGRDFLFINPVLRPLIIVTSILSGVGIIIAGFRAIYATDLKQRILFLLILIIFLLSSTLSGSRGALIDSFVILLAVFFVSRPSNGVTSIFFIGPAILSLAIYLALFRNDALGDFSGILEVVERQIFFAGNFPDFRNMPWFLAYMEPFPDNGLWGRSIIVGVFSFVPSGLMPWRAEYAFGNIGPAALQLDASTHAGVRGMPFTEWYFNFGHIGIVISMLSLGYFIRVLSSSWKLASNAVEDRCYYVIGGFVLSLFFISLFTSTIGMMRFYAVLPIIIAVYFSSAILNRS